MKKLIFLVVLLFTLSSCSKQADEPISKPIVEINLIEVDNQISQFADSDEISINVMTHLGINGTNCPKCMHSSWRIYETFPLHAECKVCGFIIIEDGAPKVDDPEIPPCEPSIE